MTVDFFSAVIIVSKNAERLASFYRDVIGIPLEDEQHGESDKHYGCELGDLHFAIHNADSDENPGVGAMKIAFEVFDIEAHMQKLEQHGIRTMYPTRDLGFMKLSAILDPDGNVVEFTQLSEDWYKHLEKRRSKGHDIIQRWKDARI